MIVRVDVASGSAVLDEPENCRAFHVAASGGDPAAVAAALGLAGSAEGAPADHVWVGVDWVRAQAAGRVPESWNGEFEGMLAYASTKGWLNADGSSIQAHIAWS
jgi:hypothetical protein